MSDASDGPHVEHVRCVRRPLPSVPRRIAVPYLDRMPTNALRRMIGTVERIAMTVNISPAERAGRVVVGAFAVLAGVILLSAQARQSP
jgi:hypothetical protein